jgi:prolyl-tRNA synthetase
MEFMVRTDAGEDHIVHCEKCGYAANIEKATSSLAEPDDGMDAAIEEFPTPGVRTIEDLINFPGGAPADRQIKTLVYLLDDKLTLVLMRGDHELNETKLADATGTINIRPAQADEIVKALGALAGSLGAVGVTRDSHPHVAQVIVDEALRGRRNMTTGANKNDYHLRGISINRDISIDKWASLRSVRAGETCSNCGGLLDVFKAVEVGHIFKLGTKYSNSMGARVLLADGNEVPIVMGSYGIGVERAIAAVVELCHDEAGIAWPISIAPFHVVIIPVNVKDRQLFGTAEQIFADLLQAGVEALLDDRNERVGVKFNDADLIGVPYRITVGNKVKEGKVELMNRKTRQSEDLSIDAVCQNVLERIRYQVVATHLRYPSARCAVIDRRDRYDVADHLNTSPSCEVC